ncbi:venom protein 302-like isoform X2 [Centruroides sculpturatus]|uniref:venom protein 302-like isoform X2 n=1 Tax=Centruroides sculpturatus TaxID=218467 RepID=UPI000C6CD5AD|nr:venom protein 302-like isoform X2 [Centruroides sculpturatus]
MKSSILLLVLACCIIATYALDCPSCDKSACQPHGRCVAGVVKDVCGCCDVCAKRIGEECGGPDDIYGKCARWMLCVGPFPPPKDVKDTETWY